MAENIGKIIVSIEAEVAELRKGLAQAEAEFKKSAKRLEEQQKNLGTQFKKSWTELAAKVAIYEQVLSAATKAVSVLSEAITILGDDSKKSHEKTIALFDSIASAGIPIVSQFAGLIQALAYLFTDLNEVQQSLLETQSYLLEQQKKISAGRALQAGIESLERQVQLQQLLLESEEKRAEGENGITESYEAQRVAMQAQFDAANKAEIQRLKDAKVSERFYADQMQKRKDLQAELIEVLNEREKMAHEEWLKRAKEKEAREKEIADRKAAEDIKKAKAVADKTMDLQTRLDIMIAKSAGDLEKAQRIAIDARYAKMMENASKEDQRIMFQMKLYELAAMSAGDAATAASTTAGGGGGTATVGTAIGAFTVATGRTELKKQTNLLRRIANATEKLGEGEVVVLAA